MFRRRLSLVLIFLAATIGLQGMGAVLALREVEQQVVRGRIASDIHEGFILLSSTKQRLRSWATQYKIGAGGEAAERDALIASLQGTLAKLAQLTQAAADAGPDSTGTAEQIARREALQVLDQAVRTLAAGISQMQALQPDAPARQGWDTLNDIFERPDGRDLRQLIGLNIARESAAVERERAAADRALAQMQALWISMALALALLSLAATAYFGRALRAPLDALVRGAKALGQGQLTHRIVLKGHDEFSDVARSMNAMAEELERHRQREAETRHELEAQVHERTRALHEANESLLRTDLRRRQLLADISHELRTPTTAIRGEAEITLRGQDRPAGDYREALQRIVGTSRQLGAVIDDLLAMARSDMDTLSLVRQVIDFSTPLQHALAQAQALAAARQVRLECQPPGPEPLQVLGDAQRLGQLLLLLLDNAVGYSHPEGRVSVSVQLADGTEGTVDIRIVNQGIGIAPDEMGLVFERQFRGRAARLHRADGSGLGLPLARALTLAHGGSLQLESRSSKDALGDRLETCALLRLPLYTPQAA